MGLPYHPATPRTGEEARLYREAFNGCVDDAAEAAGILVSDLRRLEGMSALGPDQQLVLSRGIQACAKALDRELLATGTKPTVHAADLNAQKLARLLDFWAK
jgi:hypothetical protein